MLITRRYLPLLVCFVVLLVSCALLGSIVHVAVRTGSPWSFAVPLPKQQRLMVWVQPCGAQRIGGVAMRYSDNARRNRFVNGSLQTLAQLRLTGPCP